MAVNLAVQNNLQVVVPLRIMRAANGAPQAGIPDIDDRGWRRNAPAGLNDTGIRGPVFGITVGKSVTVRVVLEDIDASARLFAVAQAVATPQFSVTSPGANNPIPPSGDIVIMGLADNTTPQKLEIRLGSATGPVLLEAQPHVFSPLTLQVQPHVCTIHQSATAATGTGVAPTVGGAALDVARIARGVNAVWEPAGIAFNFAATQNDVYTGYARDDVPKILNTTDLASVGNMVAANHTANRCNMYFVRYTPGFLGIGVNRDTLIAVGWTHPGCVVGVEGYINSTGVAQNRSSSSTAGMYQQIINDTAHELGHYLSLMHVDNNNSPGRTDTFTRRCLMHPNNLLPIAGGNIRFDDIGYGTDGAQSRGHRGHLITLKKLSNIATDCETVIARRRFTSANLY